MVKVSAAQTEISNDVGINLDTILSSMKQACGSDIICFPETSLTGEARLSPEDLESKLKVIGGKAKELSMWVIVSGYAKRGDKVLNEVYVLNRNGQRVLTYQKMRPWRVEEGVAPGPQDQIPIVDTDFGRIGVLNCYDITFSQDVKRVVDAGAEILFFPAYWFDKPRDSNVPYSGFPMARSYEFLVPVVFCDAVSKETTGLSQIVVPEKILAMAHSDRAEIITVALDLSKRAVWRERFPGH